MTSQSLRFQVLQESNYTCAYCGGRAPDVVLEVDHIVPRSRGGTNDRSNLVSACFSCNRGKRDAEGVLPPLESPEPKVWPVGAFFHYLDEDGFIARQGRILSLDGDTAWVELYSFLDGQSDGARYGYEVGGWQRWKLYETPRAMRFAWVLEGAHRGLWPQSEVDNFDRHERSFAAGRGISR